MTPAAHEVLATGGTIITATQALARDLRTQWDCAQRAQRRQGDGALAWPAVDVLPWEAAHRRHWEQAVVAGTPAGDRRLLSEEESRILWRRSFLKLDHPGDPAVLLPLAQSAWRLCATWAIDQRQLEDAAEGENARLFVRWAASYRTLLDARGWIDPAMAGPLIAADIADRRLTVPGVVGFAGFDPWHPAGEGLRSALEQAGSRAFVLPSTAVESNVTVEEALDGDDELFRAARWAREHLSKNPGASIAIVVPELDQRAPQIRRSVLDVLSPGWQLHPPAVMPVALSGGRVLADYPVVHLALLLLEAAVGELSFEQASQLLRSMHLRGAGAERGRRAAVEIRLRDILQDPLPTDELVARSATVAPLFAQQIGRLAASLAEGRASPGTWAPRVEAALEAAGWSPGDRVPDSEELQARRAWQELLRSFAACDEVLGPINLRTTVRTLGEFARRRAFQPEAIDGAVHVMNRREASGRTFDALWVCGMTEEAWPPVPRPHPLIPLSLQRSAGIPDVTPAGTAALASLRLARLAESAAEVVFSWPAREDDAERALTPLLRNRARRAGSPGHHALRPDRMGIAASAPLECIKNDPPPPRTDTGLLAGGAGLLDLQARCPARAFIEGRLQARELRSVMQPLDARMRGTLTHRTLEYLYRNEDCREGLGALPPARRQDAFNQALDLALKKFNLPANDFFRRLFAIERARLWPLVERLAEWEQGRGHFVVETEKERPARIGPLLLSARPDRIDGLDGDRRLILDYKTGASFSAAGWFSDRLTACQLPLYAVTLEGAAVLVIRLRRSKLEFRGVGAEVGIDGIGSASKLTKGAVADWPALLARWQSQLTTLADEFQAGDFRIDPTDDGNTAGQFATFTRCHALTTWRTAR